MTPLSTHETKAMYAGRFLDELADLGATRIELSLRTDDQWEATVNTPDGPVTGGPHEFQAAALESAKELLKKRNEMYRQNSEKVQNSNRPG